MTASFNNVIKHFSKLEAIELYKILQLRISVFIVEQNCPYQECDGKDIAAHHVMLFDGEELIGTTRILPPGVSYEGYASIGRVVTATNYRQKNAGMKIMDLTMKYCEELYPNNPIKISAQSYLLEFYKRFGFTPIGKEYMEDNIPHTAMIKAANKI
jgi:ElaA protein